MRYLKKTAQSEVIKQELRYSTQSHRRKIRSILLKEQKSFCAYTEHYIKPPQRIDSPDVEHFDNRLKNTDDDNYWNWYVVHHSANTHKRRLGDKFLPIMQPYYDTIHQRIKYEYGAFCAIDKDDIEALNLIEFLDWNHPDLADERAAQIQLIQDIRELHQGDDAAFVKFITERPQFLSFITVLEAELGLSLNLDQA